MTVPDRPLPEASGGKAGERSRSFEQARHPLREKGRDLFLSRDFCEELRALVPHPARILVLGSGDGKETRALQRHFPAARVVAMDLSEAEILSTHQGEARTGNLIQGDWDCTPFASEGFDLAVFFAALHHSAHLDTTLSEVARILVPGGWVYATHEPMASFLLGRWQRKRMAQIAACEGGIETSPSWTQYTRACQAAGLSGIRLRPCSLNRIRLIEMNDGFADVRLRRSDLPERLLRCFLRGLSPFGKRVQTNLIFSAQKLALGLFGVTLVARKGVANRGPHA